MLRLVVRVGLFIPFLFQTSWLRSQSFILPADEPATIISSSGSKVTHSIELEWPVKLYSKKIKSFIFYFFVACNDDFFETLAAHHQRIGLSHVPYIDLLVIPARGKKLA